MSTPRKPYPSDVTDEEWAFVAPYLTLMTRGRPAAPARPARGLQRPALARAHRRPVALPAARLPAVGGGLPADPALAGGRRASRRSSTTCARCCGWPTGRDPEPTAVILDGRTLRSTPESGHRAGYDGHKKTQGLARCTPPSTPSATCWPPAAPRPTRRSGRRSAALAAEVQEVTGDTVELAFVDQGYTGEDAGRGGRGARHRAGGRQPAGGQEGLRAAAPALGRRALLRLGGALPPPGPGLRTVAGDGRRACISSPSPA